jgi:hypothetical protein
MEHDDYFYDVFVPCLTRYDGKDYGTYSLTAFAYITQGSGYEHPRYRIDLGLQEVIENVVF